MVRAAWPSCGTSCHLVIAKRDGQVFKISLKRDPISNPVIMCTVLLLQLGHTVKHRHEHVNPCTFLR